jgi:hypothetical protein
VQDKALEITETVEQHFTHLAAVLNGVFAAIREGGRRQLTYRGWLDAAGVSAEAIDAAR